MALLPAPRTATLPALASLLALALTLSGAGCGGSGVGPDADGGPGADRDLAGQDPPTDSTPADGGDGGPADADGADLPAPDAADGADGDATLPCGVGASVSATVDETGAVLELCGALLEVPAGALAVGATVNLEIVSPPAEPPFERAFVGLVVRTSATAELQAPTHLTLPDDAAEPGYRELARYDENDSAWYASEACPVDGALRQDSAALGTYSILRDVNVYPDSPGDLGEGTVQTSFQAADVTWTTDGNLSYAIFETDGLTRSVQVLSRRDLAGGGLQSLDLRFFVGMGGFVSLQQVMLLDTTDPQGGWSYLEPVHGPADATDLSVDADGRLTGTFTVTLHQGDPTEVMTGTVDVLPERYRFPPEGACLPPEG